MPGRIPKLSVQCHVGKCYAETLGNVEEANPLMSRFNRETHSACPWKSAKTPQVATTLQDKKA